MALKDLLTAQDFQSAYLQQYPLHGEFSYGAGPVIASGQKGDPGSGVENFKTTPFGKDQPKGGSSRQPYIKAKIPIGDDNYAFKPYATFGGAEVGITSGGGGVLETINTISSGLIRGGVITAGIHSATDALRLAQFGIDLERGIPFIAKQVGLQLSNVKLEAPSPSATNPFNNTRIYNLGVNTIAQAGVNAFGLHFKRHGLFPSPSEGEDDKSGYASIVTRNNADDSTSNRLINLWTTFRNGNKEDIKELYSYNGGPKSVYGIGQTTIRSYTNTLDNPKHDITGRYVPRPGTKVNQIGLGKDREKSSLLGTRQESILWKALYDGDEIIDFEDAIENIETPTPKRFGSELYTTKTQHSRLTSNDEDLSVSNLYNFLSLDQPSSQRAIVGGTSKLSPSIGGNGESLDSQFQGQKNFVSLHKLRDFREVKGYNASGNVNLKKYYQQVSSNYGTNGNMESRLGIGTGFDKMGELAIIRTIKDINSETKFNTRDLIKFFIEAIDNDSPSEKDYIQFRAFLDSFNESYRAKWKSYNFIGNPEPFYNYDSFDRGISLSFKIAAFRREELRPLYIRLNALISQLFPDYAVDSTRARAPYVKLTVGSYLDRQPGFIESLSIKWDKNVPWEIAIVKSTGEIEKTGEVQVLPHVLDISMKFQPIHTFVPRKVKPTDSDVPFITLNSRNGGNDSKRIWIGKGDNFKNAPGYSKAKKKIEQENEKATKEKIEVVQGKIEETEKEIERKKEEQEVNELFQELNDSPPDIEKERAIKKTEEAFTKSDEWVQNSDGSWTQK
jgi:hypothetical protein